MQRVFIFYIRTIGIQNYFCDSGSIPMWAVTHTITINSFICMNGYHRICPLFGAMLRNWLVAKPGLGIECYYTRRNSTDLHLSFLFNCHMMSHNYRRCLVFHVPRQILLRGKVGTYKRHGRRFSTIPTHSIICYYNGPICSLCPSTISTMAKMCRNPVQHHDPIPSEL